MPGVCCLESHVPSSTRCAAASQDGANWGNIPSLPKAEAEAHPGKVRGDWRGDCEGPHFPAGDLGWREQGLVEEGVRVSAKVFAYFWDKGWLHKRERGRHLEFHTRGLLCVWQFVWLLLFEIIALAVFLYFQMAWIKY